MSVLSSPYPAPAHAWSQTVAAAACDADQALAHFHAPQAATRQHRASSTASTEDALDDCDGYMNTGVMFASETAEHNKLGGVFQQQPFAPQLPPHRTPSQAPPAITQSTPAGTRRLSQTQSSAATPASQPSSPQQGMRRLQSETAKAAAALSQANHVSVSYHPDIPLASAPASLHHRPVQQPAHLNKFLSSPLGSALLLNKLRSGAIFLKHGQRGLPHYRYVWVREEEGGRDRVCWAELRRRDKVRGWMEVRSLLRVEEGHSAGGVFSRSRGSDPRRCFSVVGEDRSLELECISEEEREMWAIAFAFLIEHSKRAASTSGSVGVDLAGIPPALSLVSALELLCEQNQSLAQSKLSATATSTPTCQSDEERHSSTATTAASSCYSTPDRPRSTEGDVQHISYTVFASQQQPPLPYPHVSPSSQVRVSHVNRFEVIDIVDDGLPMPPPHHIAAALPLSTSALLPPAASDDPRVVRLHADLELYKADNRRLLLSHAHKMMALQREIDELLHVNTKLRQMKVKADKSRGETNDEGDAYQPSDESDD